MDILSIVAGGLVGAVVTLVIQLWWQSKVTARQLKFDCLRRMMAYRTMPPSKEFAAALNEILFTFNDSDKVVINAKVFLRAVTARTQTNEQLFVLIRSMMTDVGLKHKNIEDDVMLMSINGF